MSKYPNLSKISVLYVEDDLEIQTIFTNILKRFSKKVYIANNGEEALKKFRELKPDLIITDIQMPKMNGIEMIRSIRMENENIPIIITTAFNDINYAISGIKLGVDGFFLKRIENIKHYLAILEKKAKLILLKKDNEKKEKIIETLIENFLDITFFVENNQIDIINEKARKIIKENDINQFFENVKPKLSLQKIEKEIIEYKNNFYSIKIDSYSDERFIITMNKLS